MSSLFELSPDQPQLERSLVERRSRPASAAAGPGFFTLAARCERSREKQSKHILGDVRTALMHIRFRVCVVRREVLYEPSPVWSGYLIEPFSERLDCARPFWIVATGFSGCSIRRVSASRCDSERAASTSRTLASQACADGNSFAVPLNILPELLLQNAELERGV
jgi:hypothetical protein